MEKIYDYSVVSLRSTRARLTTHGVAHTHAGSEVGVGQSLGSGCFEQRAHYRVATRIPSGRYDRNSSGGLGCGVEAAAEVDDRGVDVKAVDSIDAGGHAVQGVSLHLTGGSGQDSHVYVVEHGDVGHHGILGYFRRNVRRRAAHYSCDFKVRCSFEGFYSEAANIAVTHYGCTDRFAVHQSAFTIS